MRGTILTGRTFGLCNYIGKEQYQNFPKMYGTKEEVYTLEKKQIIHPYRKLHPWKSVKSFSQHLLDNVIYNKDGLVAINKPYGISAKEQIINEKNAFKKNSEIPNSVQYTLSDSLEFLAEKLGYANLKIVKSQEKFISGLTLLSGDPKIEDAIIKSYNKSIGANKLHKFYWIVTTRVPNQIKGKEHLCLKHVLNKSTNKRKISLVDTWSMNDQKRHRIKILNVEWEIISNSTNNLSSLIEINVSTTKWHALRLYCATRLYAPVLGDNLYANRICEIMGNWVLTNPFIEVSNLPKLNNELLALLHLSRDKQVLIPCHIHARRLVLFKFLGKESLTLEAPLIPPLNWTCKQLNFKNIPELEEIQEENKNESQDLGLALCT